MLTAFDLRLESCVLLLISITCFNHRFSCFSGCEYHLLNHCFSGCRTLSEFWHWFVANIPGDAVDEGEVLFDLLFPLVLPEGDGDHR